MISLLGGLAVKENMYTHHYFKQRAISKGIRFTEYVFHLATICFLVYGGTLAIKLIKL